MKNTSEPAKVNTGNGHAPIVAGIDAARLRSFVERIQRLHGEHVELNDQIKEVYAEAAVEFNKRTLKRVIERLRRNRTDIDAEDFEVAQYEAALGIGQAGEVPPLYHIDDLTDLSPPGARAREEEARAAGRSDGFDDCRDNAKRWPPGVFGHADYEFGWNEGEADRLMETPRPRARGRKRAST